MKKTIGMLSVVLALTIAVNAVSPAMSETIRNVFSSQPQVASVLGSPEAKAADGEETAEDASGEKEAAYEDGKILIYSFTQLSMIGSGKSYQYDDGVTAVYASDAEYKIARDIPVPRHTIWQLPDGFKGKITGEEQEYAPLYDSKKDAIYLYNPYQLAVTAMEDRECQPVMSGDSDAASFGTGKVVCTDEANKHILTYSDDRNYVVSVQFSSEVTEKPISVSSKKSVEPVGAKADSAVGAKANSSVGAAGDGSGRDFDGQVIKKIDGETYILIGNEAQLRAIGTDAEVFTPVYQTDYVALQGHVIDTDANGKLIQLYGGDADLLESQNGYKDYEFHQIDPTDSYAFHIRYYTGVNQETGEPYLEDTKVTEFIDSLTEASWHTGHRYTIDSNYIIFRDIDLGGSSDPWTPLMFTGKMIGAKSDGGEKLWNGSGITDSTAITATAAANRPLISEVYVNQNTPLSISNYIGVGFFATISNQVNIDDLGISGAKAVVKNIDLHDVHVENNTSTSTASVSETLLNSVTSGLGTITGKLLDVLLNLLSLGEIPDDSVLSSTFQKLLDARKNDPTIYSTGAFAGRIYGDVMVEDCRVSGTVSVSNVNSRTGDFVGYTEGITEYSGLSNLLGGVTIVLADILNVIPAIGLGDLVTILLGNTLDVGKLVPTGYKAPSINNCEANGLTGFVGTVSKEYAGGFIGEQIGTVVSGCSVTNATFTVRAKNYGGGFCGLARDAVISGTLDAVGVDISQAILQSIQDIHPQSALIDCSLNGWDYHTGQNVTGENYLGGFVGATTSTYAVDCTVDCGSQPLKIHGTGECTGGFAGCATVGWQSSLGADDDRSNSLLGVLDLIVTDLIAHNPTHAQMLLSLMGISPSAIIGCQVYSSQLEAEAEGGYCGGLVGKGDALYLGKSNQAAYTALNSWNSGTIKETPIDRPVVLTGLKSVTSGADYAGGVSGYMGSAAFQGLLNDAVGLGDFIGFTAGDVAVTGVEGGYTVTAAHYNAGGFGWAVGGTMTTIYLYELKRVQVLNRSAGFVGIAGPGELTGTGGLTVNLLGLNEVLSVSNLLNIGQGVEVEITNCVVSGISDGFEVEAMGNQSVGRSGGLRFYRRGLYRRQQQHENSQFTYG